MILRKIYFAAVAVLSCSMGYAADPATIASNHPILGIWTWKTPSGCSELYNFKADNRFGFASDAEIGESLYTIAEEQSQKGYYRIENTVAKDNGLNDCRGQPGTSGTHSTLFARFNADYTQVKMCFSESEEQCFGPLKRELK